MSTSSSLADVTHKPLEKMENEIDKLKYFLILTPVTLNKISSKNWIRSVQKNMTRLDH